MKEKFEEMPAELTGIIKSHGRSFGFARCPFCGALSKIFLWSIRGGGKKCNCGAKFVKNNAGFFCRKYEK